MLIRLSTPEGYAVPLDELKAAIRIDYDDDDAVLQRLIRSETRRFEDFTGRIMLPTDLEYRTDRWPHFLTLPAAPVRSVTEVAYLDTDHAEQTIGADEWYSVPIPDGSRVYFTDVFSSPSISDREQPIRVRFVAGYDEPGVSGSGDDPELVPVGQDQAIIILMVQWLYDRDEPMPDDLLRRMAGNRRIYR